MVTKAPFPAQATAQMVLKVINFSLEQGAGEFRPEVLAAFSRELQKDLDVVREHTRREDWNASARLGGIQKGLELLSKRSPEDRFPPSGRKELEEIQTLLMLLSGHYGESYS